MKELDRRIAHLTDGWGMFVEGTMSPSAVKIFSQLGYKIITEHFDIKVLEDKQVKLELDMLMVAEKGDEKFVLIGEAKSFCSSKAVKEFIKRMEKARAYFKEYREYKMIGFIGGMKFGTGADIFAAREGFYILKPSGETMVLDVPRGFIPKIF